jgi:predicted phage terminase large subunit-like protein
VTAVPAGWRPHAGAQTKFLASSVYEVLYGGAAGGGKSEALIAGALRLVGHAEHKAILLRRTFPELEKSLIERAPKFCKPLGGRYNEQKHVWTFPSGAKLYFGHLEHESDVDQYQSVEFSHIGFDELTLFTETQYRNMLARARSTAGLPIEIRAGSNPGGEGHEWVQRYWGPWLDLADDYEGPRAEPRETLWYVNVPEFRWLSGRDEAMAMKAAWAAASPAEQLDMPYPLSRTFHPARVEDNPTLMSKDPAYVQRLMGLDQVRRRQLRNGDWMVRPAAGLYFKRAWFKFVDAVPAGVVRSVRYWDLAGTEPNPKKGNDPDWTVGVKLSLLEDGRLCIADVQRDRVSTYEVEKLVEATAELDGTDVPVWIGEDPGQAGKSQLNNYSMRMRRWAVRGWKESGELTVRAGPVSAQSERGNVLMVRGRWNEAFLQTLEAFPTKGVHDDDVASLSGAHATLVGEAPASYEGLTDTTMSWRRRR